MKEYKVMLNSAKRIIKSENAFSGCVITGTDKKRSGFGNGDCLFFDFKKRVYAVADGTERHSFASRLLIERLSDAISGNDFPADSKGWNEILNRVYADQVYHYKTTLSGIILDGKEDNINLIIFHGGDSSVIVLDEDDGSVMYQTQPDMYFAGRSKTIRDVSILKLGKHHSRIIIASDGLTDLLKHYFNMVNIDSLPSDFFTYPVHRIAEKIFKDLTKLEDSIEYDDISLIVLNPHEIFGKNCSNVIIGGTTPQEETNFRNMVNPQNIWLQEENWKENKDHLRKTGILI